MHEADIASAGLNAHQLTDIVSHYEGEERLAHNFRVVPYPIARGCVATYFPEANVLVPLNHTAVGSNTPVSKFVEVSFKRAGG